MSAARCPVKACPWRGPCPLHRCGNAATPNYRGTEALMRRRHDNPPGRRPSIAASITAVKAVIA